MEMVVFVTAMTDVSNSHIVDDSGTTRVKMDALVTEQMTGVSNSYFVDDCGTTLMKLVALHL